MNLSLSVHQNGFNILTKLNCNGTCPQISIFKSGIHSDIMLGFFLKADMKHTIESCLHKVLQT